MNAEMNGYEEEEKTFPISVCGKLKHGILLEAVKLAGNQQKLAEYLGVWPTALGRWLHLKNFPSKKSKRWPSIARKLMKLTGKSIDDIFPDELNKSDFLDASKEFEITREFTTEQLSRIGATNQIPKLPDEIYSGVELREAIKRIMDTLSPRERSVLNLRFGLNGEGEHSLEETGADMEVTTERIRQIEAKALRKLQHPSRAKKLKHFVSVE